jgi:hypothetical protein
MVYVCDVSWQARRCIFPLQLELKNAPEMSLNCMDLSAAAVKAKSNPSPSLLFLQPTTRLISLKVPPEGSQPGRTRRVGGLYFEGSSRSEKGG